MADSTAASLPANLPARPYMPDGGFDIAGVGLVTAALMLTGMGLGIVSHFVSQWFWLVLLFPILIGVALGATGSRIVKLGKLRNPLIGGLAGFLGGFVAMFTMHYADYHTFKGYQSELPAEVRVLSAGNEQEVQQQLNPDLSAEDLATLHEILQISRVHSFMDYMNWQARMGVSIGKATSSSDRGINLGFVGSWIYWIVEVLIVACITFVMVRSACAEPFCVACGCWKKPRSLGFLSGGPEAAAAAVVKGQLTQLKPKAINEPSTLELLLAQCSECAGKGEVELKLQQITVDSKGNRSAHALAHATYPATAATHLATLFAPKPVEIASSAKPATTGQNAG